MNSDFTGFVLAGGKSSRMGSDKFALQFGGENFLMRAANRLKPVCESVKVVLNQAQILDTGLPVVRDVYSERGALGGIHAALKNCDTKFAVLLAVDMPLVTTSAIENLQKLALASNKHLAVVPRQSDGRLQPLCAVYEAKSCLPPLEKILNTNDSASVRDFLAEVSPEIVDANRFGTDENLFFNVNFPEDFRRLS